MSAFTTAKTALTSLGTIKKTLLKMGWTEKQITLHDKPVKLNGYHSSEKREAQLVIKKKDLGGGNAWNDLGFLKQADGTVQVIGEYAGKYGHINKDKFQHALKQNYAHCQLEDTLEAEGYFIDNVERRDGKIYITAENPYK